MCGVAQRKSTNALNGKESVCYKPEKLCYIFAPETVDGSKAVCSLAYFAPASYKSFGFQKHSLT